MYGFTRGYAPAHFWKMKPKALLTRILDAAAGPILQTPVLK